MNYGALWGNSGETQAKFWKSELNNRKPTKGHNLAFPHARPRVNITSYGLARVARALHIIYIHIYIYIYICVYTHTYTYTYKPGGPCHVPERGRRAPAARRAARARGHVRPPSYESAPAKHKSLSLYIYIYIYIYVFIYLRSKAILIHFARFIRFGRFSR